MINHKKWPTMMALVAALCGASCVVETSTIPSDTSGQLVVDWTIGGTKDPSSCTQSSARSLDVDILDRGGALVGRYGAVCSDVATSLRLYEGSYSARVWLSDGAGVPRTTTLGLGSITIVRNRTLRLGIDFPPDAFF